MNLNRLRCFLAVAEELHFHRAAERLNIAQPALSNHVAQLEQELGARLLLRDRRNVEMTAAGAALRARLHDLLPALEDALDEAKAVSRGIRGQVRIGFVGSAAYDLLPRVLRAAEKTVPNARIALRQLTTAEQLDSISTSQLDLGLVRSPSLLSTHLSTRILSEPFVVALPTGHALAARSNLNVRLLDGLPLVTLPAGVGTLRDAMLAQLSDKGVVAHIVDEVTDMPAILGLVAAGRGLALVPRSVRKIRMAGVVFRPIAAPSQMAELWSIKRRADRRPIVGVLYDLLRKCAAAPSDGEIRQTN
jgi:DNA-binding transcriptional LysR family regulator